MGAVVIVAAPAPQGCARHAAARRWRVSVWCSAWRGSCLLLRTCGCTADVTATQRPTTCQPRCKQQQQLFQALPPLPPPRRPHLRKRRKESRHTRRDASPATTCQNWAGGSRSSCPRSWLMVSSTSCVLLLARSALSWSRNGTNAPAVLVVACGQWRRHSRQPMALTDGKQKALSRLSHLSV